MSKLVNAANNIQNRVDNVDTINQKVFIDPITAYQIIKIVSEVVGMLKACMTPKEVVESASHPTVYHKRRVRAVVRRRMGRFGFWRKGEKTVEEIFKESQKQSVEDITQMFYEVDEIQGK